MDTETVESLGLAPIQPHLDQTVRRRRLPGGSGPAAPRRLELHRLIGEAWLREGRPTEALSELDVALLAEPEEGGRVHLARARALVALGRRGQARAAAAQAVEADPELEGEAQSIFPSR